MPPTTANNAMAADTLRTKALMDFDMDSSLWGRREAAFP
jgi:hypothetical protein